MLSKIINSPIFKMILIYFTCIIAHYTAAHLYTYYCVHSSFVGFLLSPFMTMSPHCQAFRWVIYNGGHNINMMWFLLGNCFIYQFKLYIPDTPKMSNIFKEKNEKIDEAK
jgi:hypothetical protein